MCGPKFCSMKITQDVRDYAATLNDPAFSPPPLAGEGQGGGLSQREAEAGLEQMSGRLN